MKLSTNSPESIFFITKKYSDFNANSDSRESTVKINSISSDFSKYVDFGKKYCKGPYAINKKNIKPKTQKK